MGLGEEGRCGGLWVGACAVKLGSYPHVFKADRYCGMSLKDAQDLIIVRCYCAARACGLGIILFSFLKPNIYYIVC